MSKIFFNNREANAYVKLIDLMRSPELIKHITKSFDDHSQNVRDNHIKEQVWVVKRDLFIEENRQLKKKLSQKKKSKPKNS